MAPAYKGHLPIAWRRLTSWQQLQPAVHRRPWPPVLTGPIIGLAILCARPGMALLIGLLWHCVLRPCGGTGLTGQGVILDSTLFLFEREMGIVVIRDPQTRRSAGIVRHVIIENIVLLQALREYVADVGLPITVRLFPSHSQASRLVEMWLTRLLGEGHGFTLRGLRGGGATCTSKKKTWLDCNGGDGGVALGLLTPIFKRRPLFSLSHLTTEQRQRLQTLAAQSPQYLSRTGA